MVLCQNNIHGILPSFQLQAQQQQQPMYPPGVGELAMPYFSSESAGIAPNGAIDYSMPLDTNERSEKKVRERDTKLKNPRITVDSRADVDDQVCVVLGVVPSVFQASMISLYIFSIFSYCLMLYLLSQDLIQDMKWIK